MKTVTIRTSLMRNFLALVIGISLVILVLLLVDARRSVYELSERLIDESSDRAHDEMSHFFGSIDKLLRSSRAWSDTGLLDYQQPDDLNRLNGLFRPLLEEHTSLSSVMVADDGGFEYLLFRDPRGEDRYLWYNRVVQADRGADAGYEKRWTRDLSLHSEGPLPPEARQYDPRQRTFYKEAPPDSVHWTNPYYFFVTHDAGTTATYKWRDATSGQVKLVAFDLLLKDVSRYTSKIRPSQHGKMFVIHPDGSLLGLPADDRWATADDRRNILRSPPKGEADRRAELKSAQELDLPVVHSAIEGWRAREKSGVGHFQVKAAGESWWAGFRPVTIGNQQLWIGVAVPERDFLIRANRRRNQLLGVLALALLAAIGMTIALSRRYSQPLEALAEQSARVRELDLSEVDPVQSPLHEVKQLADANSQMMTTLESFSRYVPVDLVRQLLQRGEVAEIGGRDADLTVLFTDIVGFTTISENMEPRDLTAHMAEYFAALLDILKEEHATVDKFVGDAIVAFWGAPEDDPDQTLHAVRAVLRCQVRLQELNAAWEARGLPALPTCFGLNVGEAVVGNIGAPRRLNYTILGDTVNTASRLEGLNRRYGTRALATEAVVNAVGDRFIWRLIDRVTVKGKTEVLSIYEPLGETTSISDETRAIANRYAAGFAAYQAGNFQAAIDILDALPESKSDPAAAWLIDRCRQLLAESPKGEWDGVTRYSSK